MDIAEDLYFDIYTDVSDYADYLQSDTSVRHNLPDLWVVAAVASVVAALANGYFGRLGELASDATIAKVKSLLRGRKAEPTNEETIEALRLLLPIVRELDSTQNAASAEIQAAWVVEELVRLGFEQKVAEEIADRIIEAIRRRSSGE